MKPGEWKLGKVWLAGALPSPHGGTTHSQDPALTDRKSQGTTSQGATVTSARGSGEGRLPAEGIHIFVLFCLLERFGLKAG